MAMVVWCVWQIGNGSLMCMAMVVWCIWQWYFGVYGNCSSMYMAMVVVWCLWQW